MLRFLIEHALPLESEAFELSTSSSDELQAQRQELCEQGRFTYFDDMVSSPH